MAFLGTGRLHCQIPCFFAALACFHGLGKIHHVFMEQSRLRNSKGYLEVLDSLRQLAVPRFHRRQWRQWAMFRWLCHNTKISWVQLYLETEFAHSERMQVLLIPPTHFTGILYVDKNNHLQLRGSCSDSCYHTTAWSADAWQPAHPRSYVTEY